MIVNFHIDQINEMMKYLDEVPHKYARGLIEYIQAHVNKQVGSQAPQPQNVEEKQESALDGITVKIIPAEEPTA
jgi:hypothetical protein